jgi:hypothetical protein
MSTMKKGVNTKAIIEIIALITHSSEEAHETLNTIKSDFDCVQ